MHNLGNPCTLTKVTKGTYDVTTGTTPNTETVFNTYSASVKDSSQYFGAGGINTNLEGLSKGRVIVPWIGEPIDTTWLYNGQNITIVQPTEAQGDIIIYTIDVEES
jgi:hypothetical protein